MEKIIFLLLSIYLFNSCRTPDYDYNLKIENRSDKIIYVGISDINDKYNDTSYLYLNYSPKGDGEKYKFQPNNSSTFLVYVSWEKIYMQQDTISLYVFDADILDSLSWEIVKDEYLVLQRYDLSQKDLINLNWKITYPPTEAMKEIKMYPIYKKE